MKKISKKQVYSLVEIELQKAVEEGVITEGIFSRAMDKLRRVAAGEKPSATDKEKGDDKTPDTSKQADAQSAKKVKEFTDSLIDGAKKSPTEFYNAFKNITNLRGIDPDLLRPLAGKVKRDLLQIKPIWDQHKLGDLSQKDKKAEKPEGTSGDLGKFKPDLGDKPLFERKVEIPKRMLDAAKESPEATVRLFQNWARAIVSHINTLARKAGLRKAGAADEAPPAAAAAQPETAPGTEPEDTPGEEPKAQEKPSLEPRDLKVAINQLENFGKFKPKEFLADLKKYREAVSLDDTIKAAFAPRAIAGEGLTDEDKQVIDRIRNTFEKEIGPELDAAFKRAEDYIKNLYQQADFGTRLSENISLDDTTIKLLTVIAEAKAESPATLLEFVEHRRNKLLTSLIKDISKK